MEEDNNQKNNDIGEDKPLKVDISKYRDVDGVSLKKLGFGLWYLENNKKIFFVIYLILGTIGFFTWSLFFYTFGQYIFIGMKEDSKLVNDMVANPGISREAILQIAPKPIQVKSVEVLLNSSGTFDIVAKIYNPSKNHYSNFTYYFLIGDKSFGENKSFILPNEERVITLLNQDLVRKPSSVNLEFKNSWTKIDRHKIRDWDAFVSEYIDFSVSDKVFYSSRESNLTEKVNLSVVEFNIKNNSAYSYRNVNLVILLYSRGGLVSANTYNVENFLSGEDRKIDITWSGVVARADEIEVIPYLNILDSKNTFIP